MPPSDRRTPDAAADTAGPEAAEGADIAAMLCGVGEFLALLSEGVRLRLGPPARGPAAPSRTLPKDRPPPTGRRGVPA